MYNKNRVLLAYLVVILIARVDKTRCEYRPRSIRSTMYLPRRLIKAVIDMYRERECLWLVGSKDYRKKDLRMKAYQEIVNYLKKQGVTEATDMLVRDKIENMRRSVRKEKSKIERFKGSYKTNLWYYEKLNFVVHRNKQSESCGSEKKNLKVDTESSSPGHSSNDPLYDASRNDLTQNEPTVKNTDNKNVPEHASDSDCLFKYLRNLDEFEALGINIAAKVRRMDSTQKIFAELLIQKVLAKGLLGQLSDATDLMDLSNA